MKLRRNMVTSLIIVVALALMACGNPQEQEVSEQERSGHAEMQVESSVSQETTDDKETIEQTEDSHEMEEAVTLEALQTNAGLEETVLVDEMDVKIIATGIEYTDSEIKLKLMLENNSDKDMSFISGSESYSCNAINGYMIDGGYLYANVPVGKKANETIRFNRNELYLHGITEIADIQLGFDIEDENYEDIYTGPRQMRTSIADSYDYEADTYLQTVRSGEWEKLYKCTIDYLADEELYCQDGVRVISEALMTNKDGEKIIFIEVQNDSEEQVVAVCSDIMVNGLMIHSSSWSADLINPKARGVITLPVFSMLDKPYWEMLGIPGIGDFTFTFAWGLPDSEETTEPQLINIAMSEETMSLDETGMEVYNENGIRIISKGLCEDTSSYSDDIHMLFLVENLSSEAIYVDDVYNSLSVNGFMTDGYVRGDQVPAGKYAFIDVQMRETSLEDNGILGIEDITEAEVTLDIKDEYYDTIAKPEVFISY